MWRRVGLVLVGAILTFLLLQGRTSAQSTANLQADLSDLRSQVSQLRSQVAQLSRGGFTPSNPASPSRRSARSAELSDDQIVDRLAILAIEAKDRLNALEARVAKLERQPR